MKRIFSGIALLALTLAVTAGAFNTKQVEKPTPRELFEKRYEQVFGEKPAQEIWAQRENAAAKCCCGNF